MFSHSCLCGSLISLVFHDCHEDLCQLRCDHQYLPSVSLAIEKNLIMIPLARLLPSVFHSSCPPLLSVAKKKDDRNLETQSQLPEKKKECSEFKFHPLYHQKLTVCVRSAVIYLPPASSRNSAEYYLSSLRLTPSQL